MTNRVKEGFPLFDTILISDWVSNQPGWYKTYNKLGSENKITFFDKRTMSDVGRQYCNLSAKERFPYGYMAWSFGVLFQGPSLQPFTQEVESPYPEFPRSDISHLITFDIPKHTSVRIKLDQDYILESNVLYSPSGTAAQGGTAMSQFFPGVQELISNTTQVGAFGDNYLANRWDFPDPHLRIPNNAVFSIELEFSQYGKELLQALPGPEDYYWFDRRSQDGIKKFPAAALIQVGLIGKRYVSQRGEQSAVPIPGPVS